MLERPDPTVLEALARLGRGAEWGVVKAWLERSRETCMQASLNADSTKSRQAQGGLMLIDELLKVQKDAEGPRS